MEHNVAYSHLHVDEAQAQAQFQVVGGSCEVVRAQATVLECAETMPVKLSGPADVGADQDGTGLSAGISVPEAEFHEEDGGGLEQDVLQNETKQQQDDDEDAVPFRCAAGEVGSGDLDVERVYKEFAAKLKLLMSRSGGVSNNLSFDKDMDSFRRLAESMSTAELQDKLNKLVAQMDHAEGLQTATDGRKTVQVVHTGSVPLSMYSPEYWQKCFPEMFPYGDGVYGISREAPLTFREWGTYLCVSEQSWNMTRNKSMTTQTLRPGGHDPGFNHHPCRVGQEIKIFCRLCVTLTSAWIWFVKLPHT